MNARKTFKILVLGASGQVGTALLELLGNRGIALDQQDVDFAQPKSLEPALTRLAGSHKISAVINAAAYTQVDKAESEEALAQAVNSEAPGVLARWCAGQNIPFVHYSTDYVFNGQGTRPWTECDATAPLNAYGRTKLAGEVAVTQAGGSHLIFRTSWVYNSSGKNFLKTMLRFGAEREVIKVVADQHGAPTYAPHLAQATLAVLENASAQPQFPSGIYHLCNTGETTWYEFALAIFESARVKGIPLKVKTVEPAATADFPTPAKRPFNSRMSTEKAKRVLNVQLPDWREGLAECMKLIKAAP